MKANAVYDLVCRFFEIGEQPSPAIGTDVQLCPECDSALSFRHDHYFCRDCHERVRENHRGYKPIWQRQN